MSLKDYKEYGGLIEKIRRAIGSGNISHAYILEGDSCIDKEGFAREIIKAILCREEPGQGCDHCPVCRKIDHGNYEDLYYARADGLSLKDKNVEQLQEELKNRPTAGERNFAIVENADSMTQRAQNRLLKTLEEPPAGTVIFLLSENTENLLRTITSRCIVYRLAGFADSRQEVNLQPVEELMAMVLDEACFMDLKDWLDKRVKDRREALDFLDSLERLFHREMTGKGYSAFPKEKIISNIKYLEQARRDVLANVNYRYAIRNLILKIGG